MKKNLLTLIVAVILTACGTDKNEKHGSGQDTESKSSSQQGVPDKLSYENVDLILNGSGYRKKYFVKVYECGLYLPEKNSNPEEVINSDSAMAVRLRIVSILITQDNMDKVVREGFVKSTNGNTAAIQPQIDQMMASFRKFPVNVGNTYDMVYIPGKGVQGYLNGESWGPIIKCTPEFRHALVGIWLCNNPADSDLKIKMLGN